MLRGCGKHADFGFAYAVTALAVLPLASAEDAALASGMVAGRERPVIAVWIAAVASVVFVIFVVLVGYSRP